MAPDWKSEKIQADVNVMKDILNRIKFVLVKDFSYLSFNVNTK